VIPADDALTERLLTLAAHAPAAPFLHAAGRTPMNYATLAQRIGAARATLGALGIARGDVVVDAAVDRLEALAAMAILPSTSTFACLGAHHRVDVYVEMLERLAPKAVLVPEDRTHPVVEAAARLGLTEIALVPDRAGEAGAFDLRVLRTTASLERAPRAERDWPFIDVTSGTTGRPKLVPHLDRQLLAQARDMGAFYAMGASDVAAHSAPVSFAMGKRTSFMLCVLNGGSVWGVAEADASALLRAVEEDRVSYVPATFAVHRELLARMTGRAPLRSSRLRFVSVSSGVLDANEMDALEAAFGVPAVSIYGATEVGNALMQPLERALRTSGSAGYPVGAEVRLVAIAARSTRTTRSARSRFAARRSSIVMSTSPPSIARRSSTAGSGWATWGRATRAANTSSSGASTTRSIAAARSCRPRGSTACFGRCPASPTRHRSACRTRGSARRSSPRSCARPARRCRHTMCAST
jgi:acyl-coenzyme A synthetase/AMP-(fatty) acid ligase